MRKKETIRKRGEDVDAFGRHKRQWPRNTIAERIAVRSAKYRAAVDLFEITDEQKDDLLLTLWSIMRSFVELGFNGDVCAVLSNEPAMIPNDEG